MIGGDPVHRHEADIVPVARVFRADIPKTNKEFHGAPPSNGTRRPGRTGAARVV